MDILKHSLSKSSMNAEIKQVNTSFTQTTLVCEITKVLLQPFEALFQNLFHSSMDKSVAMLFYSLLSLVQEN